MNDYSKLLNAANTKHDENYAQRPELNYIETCLKNQLDTKSFVKFQTLLEQIPLEAKACYKSFNLSLVSGPHPLALDPQNVSKDYENFLRFNVKFWSFRFIAEIEKHLRTKFVNDKPKDDQNFLRIVKILLSHALTSKFTSANLALVELEQICLTRGTSLESLYINHKSVILRVIVKSILKTMTADQKGNENDHQISRFNPVCTKISRSLEIFNVATIRSDVETPQILVIITNLLPKENNLEKMRFFLESLAAYQKIDISFMIKEQMYFIMVKLLIGKKLSTFDIDHVLNTLAQFCSKTPAELLNEKFTSIKSRILLNYSIDAKEVTNAIYYLAKFEKEQDMPFEEEFDDGRFFIEYLAPSFIGILLGVDEHFMSNRDHFGSLETIKQIESLRKIISLYFPKEIKIIHVKLLSTLSLLVRLRKDKTNQQLNATICGLWFAFVERLTPDVLKSVVVNISAVLYELLEDCPEETSMVYNLMLSPKNIPTLGESLESLFFLPKIDALKEVHKLLAKKVKVESKVSDLDELQKALKPALNLVQQENQRCRFIGMSKIRDIFKTNQDMLYTTMLKNTEESLETFLSKTIETIIALSSTQDKDTSAMISECLGILGAVNPIRLDYLIYGNMKNESEAKMIINLEHPDFIIQIIERIKSSLFSDKKLESENATYALQLVLKSIDVFKDKSIWNNLSYEAQRACDLCKNTHYAGFTRFELDTTTTVFEKFKSERNYSYEDYLHKFSQAIISIISETKVQQILSACSYIYKYNCKLAEYILPLTVIHIILNQPNHCPMILTEMIAIIEDAGVMATQDFDPVYAEDNTRGNEKTLNFQCTYMVFSVLDAINRLFSEELNAPQSERRIPHRGLAVIKKFYDTPPKDKLAILAAKCKSHVRALYYIEQHLYKNANQLDQFATTLQRIYVALDDPFEASAVEMVRTSSANIVDEIATNEASGRYDRAFTCCLTALDQADDEKKITLVCDALKNLSDYGDYHRLFEKTNEFRRYFQHLHREVLPYAIEASWKLSKWDDLNDLVTNNKIEQFVDSSPVAQGFLLTSCLHNLDVAKNLKFVRHQLMKPLSMAITDRSAYFRGYQNLLVFHMLSDFEVCWETSNSLDSVPKSKSENEKTNSCSIFKRLFSFWEKRNKLVQPSLKSLEPLLVWQRSMIRMLTEKHQLTISTPDDNIQIGELWLTSAELAREAKSFERAFFSLTETQRWMNTGVISGEDPLLNSKVKFCLEKARLHWDMGDQTMAIRDLKLTLKRLKSHPLQKHLTKRHAKNQKNEDMFPDFVDSQKPCKDCALINPVDRVTFAKLKMMLTHYSEEAAGAIPETLFYMYEECVHLAVEQEETYFRLARYYDRLHTYYQENPQFCGEQDTKVETDATSTQKFSQQLMMGDKEEVYVRLMRHSISAFGLSLMYGVKYLTQSMPRMLYIWYELGMKKSSKSRSINNWIESSIRFVCNLQEKLPSYYFLSSISLLLSRICHPHSGMSKKTIELIQNLLVKYPHQIIWRMICVLNDENNERKKSANQIIMAAKRSSSAVDKVIRDTVNFSNLIMDVCTNFSQYSKTSKGKLKPGTMELRKVVPSIVNFNADNCKVMMPTQASLNAKFPPENTVGTASDFDFFPRHNITYITQFDPSCYIFHSAQQPRRIYLSCDDGEKRGLLCKPGDDLRKDSRCMEFFNLINRILRRDNQSNARFFEIQTFLVLPLTARVGILEWIPNLKTLRSIVEPLYKEVAPTMQMTEVYPRTRAKEPTPEEQYRIFYTEVLPRMKPSVLPKWFLRNFLEPTSWYMARLAYTRTTAVISMGGYIIGLGDRHLDNVLVDSRDGRTVHVDFNLLFHQGESLNVPERIPFRLTHNMVAAFGVLGYEGNFRKSSEVTMRVMRKEKDALLTTLKPFMHDPCSDWMKHSVRPEEKITGNYAAKVKLDITERKLRGFPRSKKFKPLTLMDSYSVEAQVDNLIDEATDLNNLCQLYHGWCPHI